MDELANVIMGIGGAVAVIACMALDSNEMYSYYAGAVAIIGGVIAGIGYGLRVLARKRWERKRDLYYFRQRARRNEDIIWMEEAR